MADQDKPPAEGDTAQALASVLAYFELLKGWQMPITIETESGVESEGLVDVLDPGRQRLTLAIRNAPAAGLDPNDQVKLYFGMEDARWMGSSVLLHHRDNRRSFVMTLPKRLDPMDRRKHPRARNLQGISVLIRPSEFKEGAYHGSVIDLSEGGLQMRVERSGGVLSEAEGELGEGMELALVRMTGLGPGELEAAGRLIHVNRTPVGLLVGVRFRNLKGEGRRALEAYLKPLIIEPLTALPPLGHPSLANPDESFEESMAAEAPDLRTDALLRLKKRGRTILVAMPSGPERDFLVTFLNEGGFGRVLTATTLMQVMEVLSSTLPVHAVIIDGGVTEMQGLELASFVHHAKEDERCPIFLAEPNTKSLPESLVRQAGVNRTLAKPYLTPEFLTLLEEELDLRPRDEELELPASPLVPNVRRRILRRLRSVALVMPPGPERDRLANFLSAEGFTRILLAGTVAELVRALQSTTLGLAFIDWPDADVQGLEIASFLSETYKEGHVALIVAAAQPSPRHILDAQAIGVAQVLLKPYALDESFLDMLGAHLEEAAT